MGKDLDDFMKKQDSESQDCRRCETAGRGWTPGGSAHLCVELSFEVLV